MKNLYLTLAVILFAVILLSCNKQENVTNPGANEVTSLDNSKLFKGAGGPIITSISPTTAEIGDLLTITGSGFGPKRGSGYFVTIKGIMATVYQSWSQTQIKVIVPSGSPSGSGKVSVTVGSKKSNEVDFALSESSPVTIGTQTWMGYNLDVDHYRDTTPIPQVTDPTEWDNLTTGAWCYYNNDPATGAIYGKLYNWYAVNDVSHGGLAPEGWHIPTDGEFKTLSMSLGMSQAEADQFGFAYFGTTEGGKMKEAGTSLWQNPNTGATNSSGFTALPGGMRSGLTTYDFVSGFTGAMWWCSTEYDNASAWMRCVTTSLASTYRNYLPKKHGFAVRCVQGN